MNSAAILLTMAVIGVDVGWQEQKDGSIEYIIQIEPQLVGSLEEGEELSSFIRPELRNIKSYRVVVGSKKLPQNPPLAEMQRRWAAEKAAKEAAVKEAARATETPAAKAKSEEAAPPAFQPGDVPAAFQNPPAPLEFPDVPAIPFGKNPLDADNTFGLPSSEVLNNDNASKTDIEPTPADTSTPKGDESRASDGASVLPSTFQTDDTEKPLLTHVAAYGDSNASATPADEQQAAAEVVSDGETSPRPWGVLIAVFLALFASLGLNAFLGWITVEQRGRYRSLLSRNRGAEPVAG